MTNRFLKLRENFVKKLFTFLMVLLLLVIGWFFASPYYRVYQLKNAYDSHNASVITDHINFASVQGDIKSQLTPVLVTKMQSLTQSPLARLVGVQVDENAMVQKLVTQAVDNAVTPDTVASLITTQGNVASLNHNVKLLGGLTAIAMDKIKLNPETIVDLATAQSTEELNQKLLTQLKSSDVANGSGGEQAKPVASYCGINCFRVTTQVQGYPLTVEMARQGVSNWQIVKVKLPF